MKSVAVIGTRGYPSYYGGFETAVRKIAPHLAGHGWDVCVYGRKGSTRTDDPNIDSRVRTVITRGIESKSLSTLTYGLSAVLHAIRYKPDVALVMNVANGFWLPLLKLRGIPTIVNVDGIEWEREKWGLLARTIFRVGASLTARFATELIADAREIQRRWKLDFGRNSVYIAYGGDYPGELPLEPGLTHRGYVLVVARFVPENSIPEFFDAVKDLAETHQVVLVGSSGYGGPLDEMAASLRDEFENVLWLGHVSDDRRLLSLWQHAGVYFHGHSVGGTNPALVQAMAAGAPIVARDTVYNREVLGSDATFVQPNAEQIRKVISGSMISSGLSEWSPTCVMQRAEDHYSWTSVCDAYELTLSSLIEKAKRLEHLQEKFISYTVENDVPT